MEEVAKGSAGTSDTPDKGGGGMGDGHSQQREWLAQGPGGGQGCGTVGTDGRLC